MSGLRISFAVGLAVGLAVGAFATLLMHGRYRTEFSSFPDGLPIYVRHDRWTGEVVWDIAPPEKLFQWEAMGRR